MLLYLVPPLGGILIARRRQHRWFQTFFVALGVLFTLFYGFSSGTRNIFASYLVTFLIGYSFAANRRQTKEIVVLAALCMVAMVAATKLMLDFRDVGLQEYIRGKYYEQVSPRRSRSRWRWITISTPSRAWWTTFRGTTIIRTSRFPTWR